MFLGWFLEFASESLRSGLIMNGLELCSANPVTYSLERLRAVFPKSGAVFAGEAKTPLGKPAVPPCRPATLNGGGEYAAVFTPKGTKGPSDNK
jgi:hypothetical protein